MSENVNKTGVHFCRKCGCELVSTNKHKLCDNCRRKNIGNIRKGVVSIGGVLASVVMLLVTKGKKGN